ncbi:S26 family signal peptidase [Thermococcus chitonophagus]|uniref:Signal peptidase I n=1 Tax=Thermococcus chitonophagus TaxID=54262 RepID=A0A160VSS1_9EURY|nr:signal peptidase I [Thermococcus chitonophagus]ASJ17469.1 S26 family signal peptidase [Thermococcus chitonophagus]CUX78117.1 signal peptidase related [Thermococcus chitonophagus]
MRASDILILAIILGLIVPSTIGFLVGRPVFVSYVYSESMYPTLKKWDVFFINPFSKGDIGDIIVFNLSGRWTVHRVYAITEKGYITKGDNNVATDQQDGKNAPIPKNQIIGKVITIGGRPLKIPGLGKYITSSATMVIVGALGILSIISDTGMKRKKRKRIVVTTEQIYLGLAGLLTITMIFIGSMSWGEVEITYASTLAGGQREGWYLPGSTIEKNLTIKNPSMIPMVVIASGKIINTTTLMLKGREEATIPVKILVPKETRIYTDKVSISSYYPILPISVIDNLYRINPRLPLIIEGMLVFLLLLAIEPLLGDPEVVFTRRF